ncbi:MAG: DUF1016 domain-containing protein [Chitinispirillales bacterium]|jgi:hypothetical protein|nr:DUF1016 domain-containing protein [Chitinispirillales bacterium]
MEPRGLELRCFVVIELKATDFEAEYIGKLGLYISAINHQKKKDTDNPTIGMIICKWITPNFPDTLSCPKF